MLSSEKLQKLIYVAILVLAAMIKGYIGVHLAKAEQWGLATTNNNWNSKISFAVAFTSTCYAITTIPYAIGGVIAGGGIYRDYGGINSVDKNGFYGGYGKSEIKFFYIAAGR